MGRASWSPEPRVPRAGRALPAPRPRPHAAGESGSRGAGERGGARQTRGRGSAPLPDGRRGGMAAGSQACADGGRGPAPRRASREQGVADPRPRRLAGPGPASRSPSLPASPPRPAPARPRAASGSLAPSPGPPPAPHLPAARRSRRRASAPRAPPGPGAAARPLGALGSLAELCAASGGPPRRTGRPRPPPHPLRVLRGARPPGALTLPDAPSPPRLPLRPGRALPAPFVRPPLSAAPAPDPDPGAVPAPPSLCLRKPGGPGSASGAHRRTEGSPESSAQPGFGLHRLAVARTLPSRYSRNPSASTSDHPPYSTARLIPHDPPRLALRPGCPQQESCWSAEQRITYPLRDFPSVPLGGTLARSPPSAMLCLQGILLLYRGLFPPL
ncbi:formin-like protein 5 [Lutra lutra]|uniref:formin-like protein 5 n=1 Tax=Lutra lutra TaxID=9657 RepID=UPI001FD4CD53|nr:formin-like protein 5 [Lutra lutra]